MATLKLKTSNKKRGRPAKSDATNYDLSDLRPPLETRISNFKEIVELFEESTPEVKDLLTYEADILYECRICTSIFRSLLSFVLHKRTFCKDKVKVMSETKSRDDRYPSISFEDMESLDLDEATIDMLRKPIENCGTVRSQGPRKPQKKDLTSVHMLQKKQEQHLDEVKQKPTTIQTKKNDCDQAVLQVMESRQVMELESISSQDTVTLVTDGLIERSDSPVQFYSTEKETDKLICEICSRTFTTRKTLNSHMKTLHAHVRSSYSCPLCPLDNFGSPESVKRHLRNAHKKTGKDVKEFGERKKGRTVKAKPTPTVARKKTKKPGNPCKNAGGKSQEWIKREPQEFSNCNLCGERFNSISDFMIHSENCIRQSDVRSSEGIGAINQDLLDNEDCEVFSSVHENFVEITSPKKRQTVSGITPSIRIQPRIQDISSLNTDWKKLPQSSSQSKESSNRVNPTAISLLPEVTLFKKPRPVISDSKILDAPATVVTLDNTKKRKASSLIELNGHITQELLKKSRIETRSSTRLRKKLDSDYEDEITHLSIAENQKDPWKGYSRDLSTEETELWSRSRTGKEVNSRKGRLLSSQSRGKRRGRPPGRGKHTRSSSERKTPNYNQFAQDRFNSPLAATKRLFDEAEDLKFIREIPRARTSSNSDSENSELDFKGFPRQMPILNVE